MGALWWPVRKASSIWHSSSLWGRVPSSLLLSKFVKIDLFAWMFYSQDWSSLTAHLLIDYSWSSMLQSIWLLVEMNMLFPLDRFGWKQWSCLCCCFFPHQYILQRTYQRSNGQSSTCQQSISIIYLFLKKDLLNDVRILFGKVLLLKTCFHSCGFLFERAESNEGI